MMQNTPSRSKNKLLTVRETVIFAMLGALMLVSDIVMEALPNIHLIGVIIVASTVVYRFKALWSIYIYVIVYGVVTGFGVWWVPYIYVWAVLWAVVMLLPKNMPGWLAPIVYCIVCALHGLSFGIIYSPVQALLMGFSFEQTVAWVGAGFYFDIIHAVGNLCFGVLIVPMIHTLRLAGRVSTIQ